MIFHLRTYEPGDFETLYEIDQACYAPAIAYSRRDMREYLRFPGAECVVAETGAQVVGFCITARDAADGHIITLDVLEACRRQGVGSLLLAEAERRLAAGGVRKVSLETATDNTAAIAFWQKHGYRTSGVLKHYYPNGLDAWAMSKTIGMSSKPAKKGEAS
ncbi:MAG: GNAT family N-acetyltransferase [Acidobacteriia bacterium]|nr:GNAT family N-acetyltransferase [Terriglobia bacterium]